MKFLYNAPAVLHSKALIIGDTHFGMEEKLERQGIYDSTLSERIFERIKRLLDETKAERLIICGDVKENILELDRKTYLIMEKLAGITDVTVVKGNHDGGIEKISLLGINIVPAEGFVYKKIGILHGHSWPGKKLMECKYIVSAHQHPQIVLTDKLGKVHREAVWVVADPDEKKIKESYEKFNKKIKLVLLPAFNELVGSVINVEKKKQLGPILNNKLFKLNDALVVRLDGSLVGKLNSIKK